MTVIRPADANETAEAWRAALLNDERPDRAGADPPEPAHLRPRGRGSGRAPRRRCKGGYVFYENAPNGLRHRAHRHGQRSWTSPTMPPSNWPPKASACASSACRRLELFAGAGRRLPRSVLPAGVPKVVGRSGHDLRLGALGRQRSGHGRRHRHRSLRRQRPLPARLRRVWHHGRGCGRDGEEAV